MNLYVLVYVCTGIGTIVIGPRAIIAVSLKMHHFFIGVEMCILEPMKIQLVKKFYMLDIMLLPVNWIQ